MEGRGPRAEAVVIPQANRLEISACPMSMASFSAIRTTVQIVQCIIVTGAMVFSLLLPEFAPTTFSTLLEASLLEASPFAGPGPRQLLLLHVLRLAQPDSLSVSIATLLRVQ